VEKQQHFTYKQSHQLGTFKKYNILLNVTSAKSEENQVTIVDKYAVPRSLRMSSRQRGCEQTLTFDTDTAV